MQVLLESKEYLSRVPSFWVNWLPTCVYLSPKQQQEGHLLPLL